jgi:hypothetical protein
MHMFVLPEPRPVLWPLRPVSSAEIEDRRLDDGRRQIVIRHQELSGVTPRMLDWWYGHVDGPMEYAGKNYPRYLVWHPLDHISYRVKRPQPDGSVGPGSRLRITEAFQRRSDRLLRINVEVRRRDMGAAVIGKSVFGFSILELVNSFTPTNAGTAYATMMTIGTSGWPGRLGLNALLTARILPGEMAMHWARHHVEEIGNLENFLPALFGAQALGHASSQPSGPQAFDELQPTPRKIAGKHIA